MKIITIVGARPQFVKAAVVSRAIAGYNMLQRKKAITELIIHTGQHYDANMSDVFFAEMCIPKPDYQLSLGGLSHGSMTGRMLEKLEEIFIAEQPDVIMVYGDTNSTLAGALAAAKLRIPVAHVESGLRSFNMAMPEEVNRILTDRIARWLFCPTENAVSNLQKEGMGNLPPEMATVRPQIVNVGDVMLDATLFYKEKAVSTPLISEIKAAYPRGFYLATIHREDNTDSKDKLTAIIRALEEIAKKTAVVLPLHPRTMKMLKTYEIECRNIHCIEPVSYFEMIKLLEGCQGVFTDSGGLQKEAYFFERPCITLREQTEWVELVSAGANILVGAEYGDIIAAEKKIPAMQGCFAEKLYGEGRSAQAIVECLAEFSQA